MCLVKLADYQEDNFRHIFKEIQENTKPLIFVFEDKLADEAVTVVATNTSVPFFVNLGFVFFVNDQRAFIKKSNICDTEGKKIGDISYYRLPKNDIVTFLQNKVDQFLL